MENGSEIAKGWSAIVRRANVKRRSIQRSMVWAWLVYSGPTASHMLSQAAEAAERRFPVLQHAHVGTWARQALTTIGQQPEDMHTFTNFILRPGPNVQRLSGHARNGPAVGRGGGPDHCTASYGRERRNEEVEFPGRTKTLLIYCPCLPWTTTDST